MTCLLGTACIITSDFNSFKSDKDKVIGIVRQCDMLKLTPTKQREKLSGKVVQNLTALHAQLSYIALQPQQMRFFRISSNLLPMFDHPDFKHHYDAKLLFVVDHWLAKCKSVIDDAGIRVSTHPDQYTVINSDKLEVRRKAINTLMYHKYFMERLSSPEQGAVINVHLNGKLDCIPEFDSEYIELGLSNWLSFENDDKGRADHEFTLSFCERYGIRYVFDVHHHYVQSGSWGLPDGDMTRILSLWGDVRPKFHLSQSRDNDKIVRAHSDYITDTDLIYYTKVLLQFADCMIEAKAKNLAVYELYKKL